MNFIFDLQAHNESENINRIKICFTLNKPTHGLGSGINEKCIIFVVVFYFSGKKLSEKQSKYFYSKRTFYGFEFSFYVFINCYCYETIALLL